MRIDAVNLFLSEDKGVLAYGSIKLSGFTINDFKLIRTGTGRRFVSPPVKRLQDHCHSCGGKNHLLANFCNDCGSQLPRGRATRNRHGRLELYSNVAHPNETGARYDLEQAFEAAYELALYNKNHGASAPTAEADS